ncbi:bifunctional DNA-binding transcriptional regulator/O6-methylguanine-DNA methyltransferase Ada [Marinivivus vitaminiproducens]|uniref:bifunctional DNA-binding transcriptional regulator/O6-methylguanine-DNA methyltransferase Ada n=1 Tax=Marinivivus vitaminiproducens TaxID=3035935 RepID=UPI0027984EC6|nr:bifunctional DNA-binding transcriptional regulator/O6-methylguanine-DNA methyltransferase Ada [Geminicoccaceae bacterium SCSIO 64248]
MTTLTNPGNAAIVVTGDARWASVVNRDAQADGSFVYSVRTTGVYCRPSCAARLARPENVRFHASPAEAESAGFRPCKRCRPDLPPPAQRNAALVARACRLIDEAEEEPSLDDLAQAVGLSPFHFHRVFKKVAGLTPKAYAAAKRTQRVRDGLAASRTVTEAIYDAGFNGSGRFYAKTDAMLGMTPRTYRAGGADTRIRFAVGACSLGAVLVAMTGKGLCSILLGDDPEALVRDFQDRFAKAELVGDDTDFASLVAQVVGLVEAPGEGADLPLDIRGTAFQQRVWQALRAIPAGETTSYAEIARRIGSPGAVRAVASACAANPLAVAIPCHRVVRTDGGLAGYRWGIERKRALIEREAAA